MKSKRVLATFLVVLLASSVSSAGAASKSPTPTPTKKVAATKTPVAKKPAAKKPVNKAPKKKKLAPRSPSPSPMWPPVGFKTDPLNETKLYLKIPTAKELVGLLSAKTALISQVQSCTEYTCGAVLVAAESGCRWWKINSDLIGATSVEDRTPKVFGRLTTSVSRSAAQQVITVILISSEPIGAGHILSNISADCNQSTPPGPLPTNVYEAIKE